tara:strand:+ start:5303 stop:6622 length:1320 start_codon:yes stop_codon:yes gene_type:complete
MNKKLERSIEDKTLIAFISGSAGELDWILPIIDYHLKKDFNIKIVFLTRHAYISVQRNLMIYNYISKQTSAVQVYLCGGYFFEKIEHLGYLAYRVSIKLNLVKKPIIKIIYNLLSKIFNRFFKYFFLKNLPIEILNLKNIKCFIFSEFPNLRRPRDYWLREVFNSSIFFYHPHSPHIYTQDLDRQYKDTEYKNFHSNQFLLLGHPSDYFAINVRKELIASKLEKLFIGHPKYSNRWLKNFRDKSFNFRSSAKKRNKINILVLSRGIGSYLDTESHSNLVETTIGAIHDLIPNYNLIVKKHPREKSSHWDVVLKSYPSIKIIDDHILNLVTAVDFVITFWSSGAMDCYEIGVPVIELYDPNKYTKQQYFENDLYTTIYRKLGLVHAADNKKELENIVLSFIKNKFDIKSAEPHSFYTDLVDRSNNWETDFDKIISANDLK